ncbi:Serine/threonine-protein kinase PknD [Enhygromyxa salina]|uniref:Serine/threonine-protein kinase PknD n=1 Tax=Enhygromyxa salina TaxID=215803 RepID=A0A2S9YHB0_9BACT|nr:serine/threonine-protein kinase [Enhygromyxa salina]PRQ04494.1 Serine/threonine-protein kinase PknD [Enhygromyxa salina]
MNNRETVAYPTKPLAAPPAAPATQLAAETEAATLFAEPNPSQETLIAPGADSGPRLTQTLPPGSTRGVATVLPDVRSEGDKLIIVPRDQTRYQDDKLLGRGGMGEVKLAHDHDIGRKVAVKRLLDEDNPHAVARFIDEVRTVGSLEHPNIVPIHDVGVDDDGALFFVMKYVEGETLSSIIDKLAAGDAEYHKRYSFEARLDLFAGLLRALQYAHDRGLVHRDIKPENIMVGRFGEVMLMDWGIAHPIRSEAHRVNKAGIERASTETVDGSVVGTPQYMSPEQAVGEVAELDGRSDLYSAFVVLYELLTLTPYIEPGKTAMQTVLAAQERQPPALVGPVYENPHQEAVPVELRHFMRQGLQPAKDARYPDAIEVIVTLEQIRSGDFAVACPITFMKVNNTRMERFMDRHPTASMWLAGMSALAFVGGVAGWFMWALG